MKVLVIGAGGFLGQTIVSHFADKGWLVHGLLRARTAPSNLSSHVVWHNMVLPDDAFISLLRQEQPDLIINAAGSSNVRKSFVDPYQDFESSVTVWIHVLDSIRRSSIATRTIHLSSAAVYGNPRQLPICETDAVAPISPYGYHKRMCEETAAYFANIYDLSICSVRIFSGYGNGLHRQVLWDICQKALSSRLVELDGTGEETRDFIHAADIASALECLAGHGSFRGDVYNLASGISTSIRQVATLLVQFLAAENSITFSGYQRVGDPLYWQADIQKITSLGFVPHISLEEGLREYARWIRNT